MEQVTSCVARLMGWDGVDVTGKTSESSWSRADGRGDTVFVSCIVSLSSWRVGIQSYIHHRFVRAGCVFLAATGKSRGNPVEPPDFPPSSTRRSKPISARRHSALRGQARLAPSHPAPASPHSLTRTLVHRTSASPSTHSAQSTLLPLRPITLSRCLRASCCVSLLVGLTGCSQR